MPSDPTMRVTGSHDISLTVTFWSVGCSTVAMGCSSPTLLVAGRELCAAVAPRRLLVVLALHVPVTAPAQERPVGELRDVRRDAAHRVLVHERHVLVGEAGHRAGHADAAHVRAAAQPGLPSAHGHVALDHRTLAAELYEAAVI